MIVLLRFLLISFLLIALTIVAAFTLCIESSPLVVDQTRSNPENIDRIKRLLYQHKPDGFSVGEIKTIKMNEKELNLLASHFASRLKSVTTLLDIDNDLLELSASWDISAILPYKNLFPGFINIHVVFSSRAGGIGVNALNIKSLKVGQISFPAGVIDALLNYGFDHFSHNQALKNSAEVIQEITIGPQSIAITYQWKEELTETIRKGFISANERQSLVVYNQFLVSEVGKQGPARSFTSLLEAMFRHARKRSNGGDPIAENRAAIIVLTTYANGGGLGLLVPESTDWEKPRRTKLRLHGRYDLVQHFMNSAALAMTGGEAMSTAIGLYKEIDDAEGGSGFSFKDLAANKAGVRFGELAVQSPTTARRLQNRLAKGQGDTMLIADIKGLVENLNKAQFERRYGGPNDIRYRQIEADIDKHINQLALYR